MSEARITPFSDKVLILAELWMDYRTDESFKEMFDYGDLAFPLAFAIVEKVVEPTPLATEYIEEIWDILLDSLEIVDTGEYQTLQDLFDVNKEEL